jgi:lipopolysaccharide transport system permease protein
MSARVILEAGKVDREYFRDLWRYRELFFVLAWRDFSVRYKQTAIGVLWAILRPALTTIVFSVIFGRLGKFPSGGTPYPVLVMCGMLPWQLFSSGLSDSGNSLTLNSALITKVYFPRLIIPISPLFTGLIDFALSACMLAVLMAAYGVGIGWQIVFLPVFVLLAVSCAAGMGIWISALNVKYRDFAYLVPFIVQFGLYMSPVGFRSQLVPNEWRLLYHLNPMVGVIDGFRWCVLGNAQNLYVPGLVLSVVVIFTIATTGVLYFRKTERSFADVI